MIILNPTSTNVLVLSLLEKTTINSPYYLFRFVSKQSKNEYVCLSSPIDTYSHFRQSFNIVIITGTPNPLNAEIKLVYGDEYNYYIYAQSSSTNVDYTDSDELVQEGIMKFNKAITERTIYERGNTTRKVYNG